MLGDPGGQLGVKAGGRGRKTKGPRALPLESQLEESTAREPLTVYLGISTKRDPFQVEPSQERPCIHTYLHSKYCAPHALGAMLIFGLVFLKGIRATNSQSQKFRK